MVWLGAITPSGYGRFSLNGKSEYTHRVAWEVQNGPIPDGKVIDHLCENRMCCNVSHLRVTDMKTNIRRRVRLKSYEPITDREIDEWVSMLSSGGTIMSVRRRFGMNRLSYISATSAFLRNGPDCKLWGYATVKRVRRYFEERPHLMP
jgi:hypothetical protein